MRTIRCLVASVLLVLGSLALVGAAEPGGASTPFAITSSPPSTAATLGQAYEHEFSASEASLWAVTAGALPPGVALDPDTGVVSGNPTGAGLFADIEVTATRRAFTSVSAGENHTCGLSPAGAADCWGYDVDGQAADQSGPFTAVDAGALHTCALTPAGAVDCWGGNGSGQATDQPGPFTAVAVSDLHSCALTQVGAVDCWGANGYGQATDQPGPFTALATGPSHSCALTSAGAADCWGDDFFGQAADQSGPFTAIAVGSAHTCALTTTGAVECWGADESGQAADQAGPYTAVAAGGAHTCALTPAGAADCWGIAGLGQADDQPGPYTAIAAGGQHSCGLTPRGVVDCWGANGSGQAADQPPSSVTASQTFSIDVAPAVTSSAPRDGIVGRSYLHQLRTNPPATSWALTSGALPDGLTFDPATGTIAGTPTTPGASGEITVTATVNGYKSITAGTFHNCGITRTGAADCWGSNNSGQATDQPGPFIAIDGYQDHTCALTRTGAVDCWGFDIDGRTTDQPGPYTAIAVGSAHNCGLTPAGAADCWGRNVSGQANDQAGPYTAVTAGTSHTCALTPAGAVDCWGSEDDGRAADQPGPYTAIAAGREHTCALAPTGAVDCWGGDGFGQASDRPGPYIAISAGIYASCALAPSGAVDCWGDERVRPDAGLPASATAVVNGYTHGCVLTPSAFCWGSGVGGQNVSQTGPVLATTSVTFSIGVGESTCGPSSGVGPFPDVSPTGPFCGDIEWLVGRGITSGYPNGTYGPARSVLRQEMAAFLYRYANPGAGTTACSAAPFSDVAAASPFCPSVTWLVDEGITSGVGDGSFGAAGKVTRGAMAAFMFRLANPGAPAPPCPSAPFPDVATSHPFCGYIDWLVSTGVTSGYPDGTFRPGAAVQRDVMAAFLHRLDG